MLNEPRDFMVTLSSRERIHGMFKDLRSKSPSQTTKHGYNHCFSRSVAGFFDDSRGSFEDLYREFCGVVHTEIESIPVKNSSADSCIEGNHVPIFHTDLPASPENEKILESAPRSCKVGSTTGVIRRNVARVSD
jgi:hypothetical protein